MAKFLVILEAPGKVKKVQSFLNKDYKVMASAGHIRDLPEKNFGIDVKKDFAPTYEVYADKKNIVSEIVKEAQKAELVYIFTDLDREGEGIAFHISEILPKGIPYKRAKSDSITKKGIDDALANAGEINQDLVDSYEARRILDRCVGYKCSFVTKQATGGTSAGRVQSAALRILAEREKEIQTFVPQEYYDIEAELLTQKLEKIIARIKTPEPLDIKSQPDADKIVNAYKKGPVKVSFWEKKPVSTNPQAPFVTSALLQSASSFLGWSPKQTMSVAQKLYEKGHITYHRTDSTFMVPEFISAVRTHIKAYGAKYLPNTPRVYANKQNAQEAHECVRPTHIEIETLPASEPTDEQKLYKMIWKRAVASQMANAEYERTSVQFKVETYVMSASGSIQLFDGWRKVWDYGDSQDVKIPVLSVGDEVKCLDAKSEKKETQPPSRYSEASIVKKLEEMSIGRPSTYASIIETLKARTYIDTAKKSMKVTDLGMKVNDFLVASNFCFVDLNFTAEMEDNLDNIANKKIIKTKVLQAFWERLQDDLKNAQAQKKSANLTDFDCPDCKSKLAMKHSKFGSFFGCSNYPDCKYIAKVGEDGKPQEKGEAKKSEESEHKCPNCGELLLVRQGKNGPYLGCRNWKDDDCKGFYNTDGTKFEFKAKQKFGGKFKKWGKKKKSDEGD